MKKNINIILLGLDFNSGNFGCSALAYSFLNLLEEIAHKNKLHLSIVSVNYNNFSLRSNYLTVDTLEIHFKKVSFYKEYNKIINQSDIIFDFTGGDSFSDIYGIARFVKESLLKQIVINKKKKLVIGPQTIGPFNNKFVKLWAKEILKNSYKVYTRDSISKELVDKMSIKINQTTDVAFMLPPDEDFDVKINKNNKLKIGFNISGLLWNGGYTGKNEFGLKLDYKELCKKIIEYLTKNNYEVHLIAHVISQDYKINNCHSIEETDKMYSEGDPATTILNECQEDDYKNIQEINKMYPDTIIAPKFNNPMEAKQYLKNMDFFIGSRMHATVGAFSMGVPTVSIAYSRKFSGLYNSLGYPYVIDAKNESTESAYDTIVSWVNNREELKNNLIKSLKIAEKNNKEFKKDIEKLIIEMIK